jgi:hypothetical protein
VAGAAEGSGMQLQLKEGANIENPREYADHAVEQLRQLLLGGKRARVDPRRQDFYEIEGGDETYYIHVSPITGNVVLLARWFRQADECCEAAGHFAS